MCLGMSVRAHIRRTSVSKSSIFAKFLNMLPMAMVRSSSNRIAIYYVFSALTLLVGRQKEQTACKMSDEVLV